MVSRWYKLTFSLEETSEHGGGDIYIGDLLTWEMTRLTHEGDLYDASWAPTRNLIAYTKMKMEVWPRVRVLHIMRADGNCPIEVPDIGEVRDFSWSPDSEKIAFVFDGVVYEIDLLKVFGEVFLSENWPCPEVE